ncbi:MAG: hypothetical protein R3B45_07720 [Bdellovibrionota bacterium]
MNVCGIDPGKTGGIILLDHNANLLDMAVMPMIGREIDHVKLREIFAFYKSLGELHCFLEKVSAFQGASATSSFEFGRVFGAAECAVKIMGIPVTYLTPTQWTRAMHKGLDQSMKPKDKSMITYRRLFPNVDLRATDDCKVAHDGLVDAILIAECGRRVLFHRGENG